MSILGSLRSPSRATIGFADQRAKSRLDARVARVIAGSDSGTLAVPAGLQLHRPQPLDDARSLSLAAKRVLDIAVATVTLVLLSPLMLIAALLIRVSMGPGVLFTQQRVGRGGELFGCLKFRTMQLDAETALDEHLREDPAARIEWERTRKLKNDPRITPLGRVLRKTSIDELPQLWNVLRGDMSCVGPRPVVAAELPRYGAHATEYMSVRPGLTGLWQVSGRSALSYAERVALDTDYVRRWTLARDIVILAKTVPALARTGSTS